MRIRRMKRGEEAAVSSVALRAFGDAVAPGFSARGVREFERYASPEAIASRRGPGQDVLVAVEGSRMVGMAEILKAGHLAMLFVAREARGTGVGRRLMERVRRECLRRRPGPEGITVHAAPDAVGAYRAYGFEATGDERTVNGIRFVPMTLRLRRRGDGRG